MIDFLYDLMDKLLWASFVFSILGVLRVAFMFVRKLTQKNPEQLVLNKKEMIALGIFISLITTAIFTGIIL